MWGVMNSSSYGNDADTAPVNNKFGPAPLPAIPTNQTSHPNDYNQIVPMGDRRSSGYPTGGKDHVETRLRQAEDRLGMSEQSCRALLEEVVRLRGELKQSQHRTEEFIQSEQQSRQQLSDNIRASNDLIGQLGTRIKRAEERVSNERTAVGALVNHTKQVEQAVLVGQKELVTKRDKQLNKIAELHNDLDESNRQRDQLERATTTLVDEVRALKGKVDTHHMESNSAVHDVKERTKRLEEDNRTLIDRYRLQNSDQEINSEKNMSQLRLQMNARLGEVRDVLVDLRNRVTTEETERRQQEQNHALKLGELQSQLHEQSRKSDETMHTLDVFQREREHAADNERLKIQGKIAEIVEEVSRKILSKEIRLREESQQKYSHVEKYLHAEQAARMAHEQSIREENEKRWSALQKLTEEEVLHVREGQKLDRHNNVGGMSRVNESIDRQEKALAETKKQLEAVIKAEIKSRQNQDKQIEEKVENVQEKLGVAISTLQQAIGGINEQVLSATEQHQDKMKQLIENQSHGGLRGLSDLDARLSALQAKVSLQEEGFQQTMSKALASATDDHDKMSKSIVDDQNEKIEQLDDWKDSADKKLKQIKERMDELGPEIRAMNRTNMSLKEDMKGLIDAEMKDRVRDVQMVRQELESKHDQLSEDVKKAMSSEQPPAPTSQKERLAQGKGASKLEETTKAKIDDMEEVINTQRKKYEELKEQLTNNEASIQTVKVHLARKIEVETKARREEIQDMQGLFEDMQSKLAPLLSSAPAASRQNTPSRPDSGRRSSSKGAGGSQGGSHPDS